MRGDEEHARHVRTPGKSSGTRATPPPQPKTILLGSRQITYTLRVSARARHVRLVVRPTSGLEVVIPRGASQVRAETVVREKAQWVLTTLDRMVREEIRNAPAPLTAGQWLPYAGQRVQLAVHVFPNINRARATLHGDILTLTIADSLDETLRHTLEAWYRQRAREVFAERIAHCNHHYGFTYGRVSIKEQKSRWGSCSRQGNLNFNWRLLLAPLPVLDYVVTHELAHLKELNHSPRFWQLVASACPDYKTQRRWLRDHGRELRF